ncbi:GNAT family N-acetyltransferase [Variovorax sp. J22R133]|uniref:GNAT family N-acetyltransferase n=1 Tax=Variovorax brevis TaxID=3053503 RepID=UPI002574A20F|nr:GNAT family N-acetyltransferase [Variovorax sp. J22R133]MDM0114640.1 GNAT family N-acetyltransferase [Variovorax sp. J22R133]
MLVRQASPEDCAAIARVHVASWQSAYRNLLPAEFLAGLSVEDRESLWRKAIQQGAPQLLVACDGGEVLGFTAFGATRDRDAAPSCMELWAIYLRPDAWGLGMGRALWLDARERIRASGATKASLWVIEGNAQAMRFYEAAGFTPEASSRQAFELGGVTLHELRYVQAIIPSNNAEKAPR